MTPHTHQPKTLVKNMRLATRAPSMPALHSSWHSRAAGGMARWPGRIRQHARLNRTSAQERENRHIPQHRDTEDEKREWGRRKAGGEEGRRSWMRKGDVRSINLST